MKRHILSVLVENHSGVLSKVAGLFSRRGYNIDSLTVGTTEDPKISRMTIALQGDEYIIEQITKQLNKLIDVIKIIDMDTSKCVLRELTLLKVNATNETRSSIIENVNIFRGNIIDIDKKSMTVEVTGDWEKISAFIEIMRPFGIKEIVRTGVTALERGGSALGGK
ncbi:acetolactate synthase small subunit [Clostridium cylindrosporum]|uniref:Acetolactate synthase small subunit n=1 Tax=Clostridium cylindrosporum DSM 605 TaxID=1121307 RepID=A0A0J8D5R7_CLOCY|nr:acetolactate synthase small subunit [Clostridium cylindrosporum]KMT21197.1 putative acetolactate synthase small subunit [Clostridium cylindrosporum DSM 605]